MTPKPHGKSVFEKIDCDLAKRGYLDRLSLSVDQTKICFEFQKDSSDRFPVEHCTSPTLMPRPAPSKTPSHSQTKRGKPVWFAYPRWTRDQSSIIYHAGSVALPL